MTVGMNHGYERKYKARNQNKVIKEETTCSVRNKLFVRATYFREPTGLCHAVTN